MGLGKKKAVKSVSPFESIASYNVDLGPLGQAKSFSTGSTIQSTFSPSSIMRSAQENSLSALDNNMSFLAKNPSQQLADLEAGNNTFYNLSKNLLDRDVATQLGQAQVRFGRQGLQDSTTSGAFQGQIASQATLRDLMNRVSSLDHMNSQALDASQQALNSVQDLSNLSLSSIGLTNNNLMSGFADRSATSQFNAAQQNLANRQRQGILGSLANTTLKGLFSFIPKPSNGGAGGGGAG